MLTRFPHNMPNTNCNSTNFRYSMFNFALPPRRILAVALATAGLLATGVAHAQDARMYGYRAQPGDSLIRIAERFLLDTSDWKSLQRINNVKNPHAIPQGSIVNIPTNSMRIVEAPAKVVAVQGSARANGAATQVGARVREGDRVVTGDDGFVTLQLADGSTLTVQSKSAIKLENARQLANTGGVGDSIVRLESGRLETTVAKQRDAASRYEIRTPTSNMGVRGTVFRVAADESGIRASSEVLEGKVAVSSATPTQSTAGAGIALTQGFGTVAEKDKAPLPPIELLPAPDTRALAKSVDDTNIEFQVAPVAKAAKYRGQLARDAEFKEPVADTLSSSPTVRFAAVAPGNYFVRLRAIDGLGLEGNNATHQVAIRKQLAAPVLSSGLRDQGGAAFQWQQVADAKAYRIQVARDDKFSDVVIDDANVKTNRYTPAKPLSPGNYRWRVATLGEDGRTSAASAASTLSIVSAPPRISYRTMDGGVGPVTWSGVDASAFQVQIARDENFQTLVVDSVVAGTAYLPRDLDRGFYFARVRAAGQHGPWSDVQNIEVYRRAR
jgi:hypothetical protein